MMAAIVLLEFLLLALLGSLLVALVQWENWFEQNRIGLQQSLRKASRQLRQVRLQAEKAGDILPSLELSPATRRKWVAIRWAAKALLSTRYARP